ncbi:MAG: flippase-like domain-containing protein [Longimicrobiales bacterium]|nr:flippase-like domain-containing protein [Longimicrobiales bacterium]
MGRSVLAWTIGVGLLIGLVALTHFSIGWGALLAPWKAIRPELLGVALLLVLGSYAVRAIRIHVYFHPATSGRFLRTFRLVLLHNLFNNLLPMRSGEASFPILMAREFRVLFSRSIPGLVYFRVLDLHFVLLVGVAVLSWMQGSLAWLLALFLAPIPLGIFRAQEWLRPRLQDREGRISKLGREALSGLPETAGLFWRTWLWTAVNWTIKLMVFAWILRAFTPMPFSYALLGSSTGELSSVLPFHGIAGAGSYEAGVLAGLVPLGLEMELALKAAVNLHLFVLGSSIVAGALAALFPFSRKDPGESSDHS